MSDDPTKWSLRGFCEHFQFVHEKMPDHKFVWVLGPVRRGPPALKPAANWSIGGCES